MQPLDKAIAQVDDLIDAVRRHERMTVDDLGFLSDAVDAAGALDQTDDRPRQIVVDHAGSVLEVLTFRENVRRDEHTRL